MSPRTRWIALGVLIGVAASVGTYFAVRRAADSVDPDDDERLARIDARLKSIEASMRAKERATRAAPPRPGDRPAAAPPTAADADAERAATVAEVEAFLAKRLKDDDDRAAPARRFDLGVGDAGTKSLDDAAKELGLQPEQVRRVRDAFRAEGEAQLKAAFGTDDIEFVRNRIRDARTDADARAKLQDEFLGNLLKSLPKIRRAEEAKVASLKETLGAQGYERFQKISVRESDVDEFDALFEQIMNDPASERR
jgi:hypothetical protein